MSHPAASHSPNTLLRETMENVEDLEAIALVRFFKNDTADCIWSNMSVSDVCMAVKMMDADAISVLQRVREDHD